MSKPLISPSPQAKFETPKLETQGQALRPLERDALPMPAAQLARWLIGKTLVRDHADGRMSGRARTADLARGPGRLATALDITRALDGSDLCAGRGALWLADAVRRRGRIVAGPRIGISREAHRPLRFFEAGNPSVSGPRQSSR